MKVVSACLAGIKCNYEGKAKPCQQVIDWVAKGEAIVVCPEQLGGLPTPRVPSEIVDGKVINQAGKDVSEEFICGSKKALKIAIDNGCSEAILKSKSPACGSGNIHDGTFSDTLIDGDGVFARMLKERGFKVITEKDL
jgi:uncharacterized protein YbbK (DUF523 family)